MGLSSKQLGVRTPDCPADSIHRLHEVLDHPVGLRMVRIEAIELAVDRQVDACKLLQVEDDCRCIAYPLLAWMGDQPLRDGVAANQRGLNHAVTAPARTGRGRHPRAVDRPRRQWYREPPAWELCRPAGSHARAPLLALP